MKNESEMLVKLVVLGHSLVKG